MFDVFKTAEFKRALKFYIEEVKNNSKHFLISMSSAVIWCFLVVLHPYFIKRIVDDGIVANNQQTIVVTHSPQVAAKGNHHILIKKNVIENESITETFELNHQEKIEENQLEDNNLSIDQKEEFSAEETESSEIDDEFNQETEEELLDIPTFLRRQAN